MQIFAWVLLVVGVLTTLTGLGGIINPKWLTDNKTGETPSRKSMCNTFAAGIAIFVAGYTLLPDEDETKLDEGVTASQSSAQTLDMTQQAWIRAMDARLEEYGAQLSVMSPITCQVQCVTSYSFSEGVAYSVTTLPGSNAIVGILMIGAGTGTATSGVQILRGALTLTSVLAGTTKNKDGRSVGDVIAAALRDKDGQSFDVVINNVKFSASYSEVTGLFFIASPSKT